MGSNYFTAYCGGGTILTFFCVLNNYNFKLFRVFFFGGGLLNQFPVPLAGAFPILFLGGRSYVQCLWGFRRYDEAMRQCLMRDA